MTEQEKMLQGKWYDANFDENLLALRNQADSLCFQINQTNPKETEKIQSLLKQLFGKFEKNCTVLQPVYADYGCYTKIDEGTFINHGAYFMDGGTVTIGKMCFIGPNCGFYTASHPLIASQRNQGYENAKPIVIEDNVWIGGDVTILPGVTIGEGAIIGAKSLVNKDIPASSIAFGNPCRPVRKITDEDSIF